MEYQKFYEKLLETLRENYPKRSENLNALAKYLRMDQKSLARRMRGETPFTLEEFARICVFLNISFDTMLVEMDRTVHPMKIYFQNLATSFLPESFHDLLLGAEYTALDRESSQIFMCSNIIPNGIYAAYPEIARFVYFAWSYRRYPAKYNSINDFRLYEEVTNVIDRFGAQTREIRHSVYLLTNKMIENISEYILFFHDLGILPREWSQNIIQELTHLLNELEQCALLGYWPGTENKVDIYITSITIPHSFLIAESAFFKAAIIYAFFLNPIVTCHPETFTELKTHAYSMLRYSDIISVSGEKKRNIFMKKQREALSKLSDSLMLG